jgi:hypothetical protein
MVVEVASKFQQSAFWAFVSSNIVGDSMLVRLRSTTIGILGLVAAVGLGLVAVVSQQGWPGVLSGPLPQAPPSLVQNDSIGMPPPAARPVARHVQRPARVASVPARTAARVTEPAVSHKAEVAPAPVATEQPQATGHGHQGHQSQPQQTPSPTTVAQVPSEEPLGEGSTGSPSTPPVAGSPGKSDQAPGHSGEPHGKPGKPPGQSSAASTHPVGPPGNSGDAPGHAAEGPPGHVAGEPPGHSGQSHGGHH